MSFGSIILIVMLTLHAAACQQATFSDPTVQEIWRQLSYSDNPVEAINELISKFPLDPSSNLWPESTQEIVRKFSKILQMYEPERLEMDSIYSSMLVVNPDDGTLQRPSSDVFNTYKPPSIGKELSDIATASDSYLMDGDMLISKNSELGATISKKLQATRMKRKIKKEFYAKGTSSRWPYKTVPYEFDSKIQLNPTFQALITTAINHWTSLTCIRFEPYNAVKHRLTHKAKLAFVLVDNGCYADVGYPDETVFSAVTSMATTSVFLGTGCIFGQIVHEIGHAIGFYHEQSRGDREIYVDIVWNNILDALYNSNNFLSLGSEIETNNLGVPYDLSSIMHYDATAFGINGSKTIVSKDANLEFLMGNRAGLSFYDIKIANLGYKCSEGCGNAPVCKNDGFLNSNCLCVCPSGLTGVTCEIFTSKKSATVTLSNLKLDCTFNDGFCDWIQESFKDEVDFIRNKGPTLTQFYRGNTGPTSDRLGDASNSYVYFNTYYSKVQNEAAVLLSPEFTTDTNQICLQFWYSMYSDATAIIGNLSVYKIDSSNTEDMTLLWTRSGKQTQVKSQWLQASVDVPVSFTGSRVIFKAQRYFSYFGDIAIDDITVSPNACPIAGLASAWTNWGSWTSCSVTCGSGVISRSRTCIKGSTGDCSGSAVETQACNTYVDCSLFAVQWNSWNSWSQCSATCGSGLRSRSRLCLNQLYFIVDSSSCAGGTASASQSETCANSACPVSTSTTTTSTTTQSTTTTSTTSTTTNRLRVNGEWSAWGAWDDCSNCQYQGNVLLRTRTCTNPAPASGGSTCPGFNYEYKSCFELCQVNGAWSAWNSWSSCSSTCGTSATATRTRTCTNPEPKYGGVGCLGSSIEATTCSSNPNCPVNGGFSQWSTWSSCSVTCGLGTITRTRSCNNPVPQFNGLDCVGAPQETNNCNIANCPGTVWGSWSTWSECIALSCDTTGYSFRSRTCLSKSCEGENSQTILCSKQCTITTKTTSAKTTTTTSSTTTTTTMTSSRCSSCNSWSTWGICSRNCGANFQKQRRTRTCGFSDIANGCETAQTMPCNIQCDFSEDCSADDSGVCLPKTDGGWSEWEAWSSCTVTCGTGTRTRKRYCTEPEPLNGGAACVGSSQETAFCDAGACGGCWTGWASWSSCSSTCGNQFGWIMRTRRIRTGFSGCAGSSTEYNSCWSNTRCPSADSLSSWSSWTTCATSDCSNANTVRYRFRSCLGNACTSKLYDKTTCMDTDACANRVVTNQQTFTTTTTTASTIATTTVKNDSRLSVSGWTEWTQWSSCCAEGTSTRARTRLCIGTCIGLSSETESCECQSAMPSSCSVTCNSNVNNFQAIGFQTQQKLCKSETCPTTTTPCYVFNICPSTFDWSPWSVWTACAGDCGKSGVQNRTRNCMNVYNNQKVSNQLCNGESVQQTACTTACAEWSAWGLWTPCSVTCGFGRTKRARTCSSTTTPGCIGDPSETQICYDKACPVNGQWSIWSSWSSCSVTCNSGVQSRRRACTDPPPQNGGETCIGSDTESVTCTQASCRNEFRCTFDIQTESSCQYTNLPDSNYNWVHAYMSTTANTGPWSDKSGNGRFLYAQASTAWQFGNKARMQTNSLQSSSNGQCVVFWHHMYGLSMGSLNIKLLYNNAESLIFTKMSNQGNRWLRGYTFIPANIQYRLTFEAVRGSGVTSDIGLDEISVEAASMCEVLFCDFETPNTCNYDDKSAQMLWQRTFSYNYPSLYAITVDGSRYSSGQKAFFNLPTQDFENTQTVCLSFSYLFNDITGSATLNAYVTRDSTVKQQVWSSNSGGKSTWQNDHVDIFSFDGLKTYSNYQVTFEVVKGTTLSSSVSLDNIKLTRSFCQPLKLSDEINKSTGLQTGRKRRQTTGASLQGCGGTYTLSAGDTVTVTSPNYPLNYPVNTECAYIFNTQLSTSKLSIRILDLDLETTGYNLCPDSLEVRYNSMGQAGLRLCGTSSNTQTDNSVKQQNAPVYTSRANQAILFFRSDWLKTKRGFSAQITAV